MSQQRNAETIQFGVDVDALGRRLIDDFSRSVLLGAIQAAADGTNPIRGNLFAAAIRELLGHTLHELAPDEELRKCSWFKPETQDGRPTRAQRQRYVIQGGLSDGFVCNDLGLDVEALRQELSKAVDSLNRATHLRPKSIVADQEAVETLVCTALGAVTALFDAVEHCRHEMMTAIADAVVDQATEEVLQETIQTIDELATHHSIEEVYVGDVRTIKIDSEYVWYRASGTIAAELQWGSNSDLRRGDGATLDHSFPFECDIPAPVSDPRQLETSLTELRVSDGGWRDNYYDEDK